ncbi:protein FAM110C [Callorhinchus milii]|uniref:protein FAM110C n=1 Tax=Callorhinchus milii TaxID=7868 RepID=UPI0004576027|nr:protein FAM110C [Callorhinchus milii]|eukprot:gi/632953066/ref/XP_007892204.1/ PREDICTED: protein FAM110C [Callorhinchus milii]
MPTEISGSRRMQPGLELSSSLPLRIFHKGPSYLRKQVVEEGVSRGRLSAVERLAADKAKYVKSHQVMSSPQQQQEPLAVSLSSNSESSSNNSDSSNSSSNRSSSVNGAGHPLGGLGLDLGLTKPGGQRQPQSQASRHQPFQSQLTAKRYSTKRQMRPDSLVIYRQKCEFVKGATGESPRGNNLVRRLFQSSSLRDKQMATPQAAPQPAKVIIREGVRCQEPARDAQVGDEPQGISMDKPQGTSTDIASSQTLATCPQKFEPPSDVRGKEITRQGSKDLKRRGVLRSQSDISSRYSKAFSEFDSFFRYCGLEPEVVEDIGRENFSSVSDNVTFRGRSVSITADSDSEFSRHSGENDRLLEEELNDQISSSLSVVERNARVIKWIYSCKKAKELGSALLV